MLIRDSSQADYPGITMVHNALFPGRPRTAQGWQQADARRNSKCIFHRWVAVEDDLLLGMGAFDQDIGDYGPHRFYIDIKVLPQHQRRGVGTALYEHVMLNLQPHQPHVLRANAFADRSEGFTFMQHRGFYEAWRETPVKLDLSGVDLGPYTGLEAELASRGIRIATLADLEADSERDRKLYDLYMYIDRTLPREEAGDVAPMDFETWQRACLNEEIDPYGYFVALQDGDYIGLKELGVDTSTGQLWAGLMGVLPPYRRRGIGMALQARAIAYACGQGFPSLASSTGAVNQAMQHIFDRLGYQRLPVWHQLQKDVQ